MTLILILVSNCSSKRGRKSQRNTTNQQTENQKNSTNSGESKGLAGGNLTINNIKKKNANNCTANNSQNSVKTQLTFDDLLEDTSGKKEVSQSSGNSSSKCKFSNNSTGLAPTSKRGHHLNRYVNDAQFENFRIFLPLRFYVKPISGILEDNCHFPIFEC